MPGGSSIVRPTLPGSMSEGDLDFAKLMDVFVADYVYFGIGSYSSSKGIPPKKSLIVIIIVLITVIYVVLLST